MCLTTSVSSGEGHRVELVNPRSRYWASLIEWYSKLEGGLTDFFGVPWEISSSKSLISKWKRLKQDTMPELENIFFLLPLNSTLTCAGACFSALLEKRFLQNACYRFARAQTVYALSDWNWRTFRRVPKDWFYYQNTSKVTRWLMRVAKQTCM